LAWRCLDFMGSSTAGLGRLGTSGCTLSLASSFFSCRGGGTGATLLGCCALSWLSSASGFIWGVVDRWPDTLLSAFSWFIKGCCRTFTWLSAFKPTSRAATTAGEETDDAGEGNGAAIESFTGELRLLSTSSFCSGGFSAGSGGFLWYNSSSFSAFSSSFCSCTFSFSRKSSLFEVFDVCSRRSLSSFWRRAFSTSNLV